MIYDKQKLMLFNKTESTDAGVPQENQICGEKQ